MIKCTILTDEEVNKIANEIKFIENNLTSLQNDSDNLSSNDRSVFRVALIKLENLRDMIGSKS